MKAYEDYFYEEKINEDIFTTLLKKETKLENIFLNAIYLENSMAWSHWSYYIYFYDKASNICFINDLNFYWSVNRLSVTNTIEQLSTKILPFIKFTQSRNLSNVDFIIPSFIYFHNRWYWSKDIVKQEVILKPLYDENKNIVGFSNPKWKKWNIIYRSSDNNIIEVDLDKYNDIQEV